MENDNRKEDKKLLRITGSTDDEQFVDDCDINSEIDSDKNWDW